MVQTRSRDSQNFRQGESRSKLAAVEIEPQLLNSYLFARPQQAHPTDSADNRYFWNVLWIMTSSFPSLSFGSMSNIRK